MSWREVEFDAFYFAIAPRLFSCSECGMVRTLRKPPYVEDLPCELCALRRKVDSRTLEVDHPPTGGLP